MQLKEHGNNGDAKASNPGYILMIKPTNWIWEIKAKIILRFFT